MKHSLDGCYNGLFFDLWCLFSEDSAGDFLLECL